MSSAVPEETKKTEDLDSAAALFLYAKKIDQLKTEGSANRFSQVKLIKSNLEFHIELWEWEKGLTLNKASPRLSINFFSKRRLGSGCQMKKMECLLGELNV